MEPNQAMASTPMASQKKHKVLEWQQTWCILVLSQPALHCHVANLCPDGIHKRGQPRCSTHFCVWVALCLQDAKHSCRQTRGMAQCYVGQQVARQPASLLNCMLIRDTPLLVQIQCLCMPCTTHSSLLMILYIFKLPEAPSPMAGDCCQ
jgi:hypothetical protein